MICKICKSNNLKTVLNLGNQYLSEFRKDGRKPQQFPLELVICKDCKQVQLKDTVPQSLLYTDNYGYRSGINATMRNHLKNLVIDVIIKMNLQPGDSVADIGSNDGTLLKNYPVHIKRYGYDLVPKFKECYENTGIVFTNGLFGSEPLHPKFKVITAISMFYDIEDPVKFIQLMADNLDQKGIIVIQQNYLLTMLQKNGFDNCCLGKGELVTTSNGLKPIEDIVVGDLVLTHKGRFKKVLKKFVTQNNHHQLLRLKSYGSGYDINLTSNHPVLMRPRNGGLWRVRRADQLKIGDVVYKPIITESPIPLGKLVVNKNIARIIGYYLSEGSYCKHADNGGCVGFSFNINEKDTYVADLIGCLKAEGFSANMYIRQNDHSIVVNTYGIISHWLFENFGHHSLRKYIPMWVFSLDDEILHNILDAYINGDGYKYRNKKYWRICTVSSNLAYGISLIANKLGYKCSICEQKRDGKVSFKSKAVTSKVHNLWDILIHTNPQREAKVWIEEGKQCSKIRKVERVRYNEDQVYNLEVEDDHTYVTPAMVVHNCHEHIFYHSLGSMKKIAELCGLDIVSIKVNDLNGGSFKVYICHKGDYKIPKSVSRQLEYEDGYGLNSLECYEAFADRVYCVATGLGDLLINLRSKGKEIAVCGASTRGNTLLQFCNIDWNLVSCAIERNPEKYGTKIASVGIPIISEEEAEQRKIDYYLVLPWFFEKEIVKRYGNFRKKGGKLIFPLPEVKII